MDSTFTEPNALQVATDILRQINCNQEAKALKQETKALLDKGGRKKKTKPSPAKTKPSTTKKKPSTTKKKPSTTKKKPSTTKKKPSTTKKKPSTTKKKPSTTKKKPSTTKKKPSSTKKSLNVIKFGRHKEVHFVDKHQIELTNRVSNVAPILDDLLFKKVIQQEMYDEIRKLPTTQKMMREIFSGCLKAGKPCKDIFYESLEKNECYLIDDLKNWNRNPSSTKKNLNIITFGKHKGQTFEWLLENDVNYIVYLVASHQKELEGATGSKMDQYKANKDALAEFASDNPEVLEEVRFNRAYKESKEAARSSGQNGKVLVGVRPYRWSTLKDLYESNDSEKIRQVEYLRTKKSACIPNSKMEFAIDYILKCDGEAAAAKRRINSTAQASTKKQTRKPCVQSNSSQPTNDSGPVQKKQKRS